MNNPTPTTPTPATSPPTGPAGHDSWSPESWTTRPHAHEIAYTNNAAAEASVKTLKSLPPLVTSWEIERLKGFIAQAQEGKRFLLQGGDCAETFDDCRSDAITNKLKILLQMSLVLVHGLKRPVVRVGRFAGQYAKPRSSATETRAGKTLPSYFGDLINRAPFDEQAREPDPSLLIKAYTHSALTLNFIRALTDGGFADLHHPEYWDLSWHASLSPELRAEYERMTRNLADGLKFMEALGERAVDDLTRVEFFTSHEALNLLYESAQTRTVPRRSGWYNLTAHMPWIGERTRDVHGAHVEYCRGIENPVGVKIGPSMTAQGLLALVGTLNPRNEPGKVVLITRFGAGRVAGTLHGLVRAMSENGRRVLWVCDPMHGNGVTTAGGIKTRSFDAIAKELEETTGVHESCGSMLGGIHIELTGENVTECVGGGSGVTEQSLHLNYGSPCDPRLNYQQSLELAFMLSRRMGRG